jgi:hypothetical protein
MTFHLLGAGPLKRNAWRAASHDDFCEVRFPDRVSGESLGHFTVAQGASWDRSLTGRPGRDCTWS